MGTINYQRDKNTPGGQQLNQWAGALLAQMGTAEIIKERLQANTQPMSSTTPGDLKAMLENGYGADKIECRVNQSVGGSPGNVIVGDTYQGNVTGFKIKVEWQNDEGSQADMVCSVVSGTPLAGETMTNQGSNSNTAEIMADTLVNPVGDDGVYAGEALYKVNTSEGDGLYDKAIAAVDAFVALRDELTALYWG